jgi:hypothetical protein
MKKNIIMLLATTMLLFGISGQAMAGLTVGDLIRVVYKSDGTGVEVATDLMVGATGWTTETSVTGTTSYSANNFSLSQFGGSAWSDLSVAYYANTFPYGNFWFTGPDGGMESRASKMASLRSKLVSMNGVYSTVMGTGKMGTINSTAVANSYWNLMDMSGLEVASWGMYVMPGNARANLAPLASEGFVDQWLYYYPGAISNTAAPGVQVAKIRTYTDGHTDIMNVTANPVPIPAGLYLFGTGLLGLIGVGRKMKKFRTY